MQNAESPSLSRDASFEREALACLPQVTRFARALARDAADVDDLVQETFLRAYNAWSTYTPGTSCRSWLFTICRNLHLRSVSREKRVVSFDDPEAEAITSARLYHQAVQRGLDSMFDRVDLRGALERSIASLTDEYRSVVVLIDLQDCSYAETADALGIPVGTVRSRLFRARRILQEQLLAFAEDAGFNRQRERQAEPGPIVERTT